MRSSRVLGDQVIANSNEIMKQLNRLANDRNLPPNARKKLLDAVRHIKDLQLKLSARDREPSE